jgi:nucleotide-binding universal stress UspA family protein
VTGWNRICCAVDFSQPSRAALARASGLAAKLGATLTLVHAFSPPAGTEPFVSRRQGVLASASLARNLAEWRVEAEATAGQAVEAHVLAGPAADAILRFVGEHSIDVLVLGTSGRTGLRRVLHGSVAEEVVRRASCPVLVVHGEGLAVAAAA